MISRHAYRGGVWVDLEQPTDAEIHAIANEFGIGKIVEREIVSPTPSPIVVSDGSATLTALHFPSHGSEEDTTESQEVDFIVGKEFIITVRYEVVAPLYHLKKLLETQEAVSNNGALTTDALLEVLFAHLYTAVRDHTDHVADNLTRVERQMFDGHERETVRRISGISREFLHMEAALANQEESLGHFLKALHERKIFGDGFTERAEHIRAERTEMAQLVKVHRAIASELRETNIALLEVRQNEIMKTLTVVTFIFLPLELITFIFSMHALGTPLEKNPNAFWIIMAAMVAVGIVVTAYVARKRWIF